MYPPKLNKKVFKTTAVDNIDHNPSSATAQGAFHGTGISLFQHPGENDGGEERAPVVLGNTNAKRLAQLPDSYTTVQPVILPKTQPPVPPLQGPLIRSCLEVPSAFAKEFKWLDNVRDHLNQEISKQILDM